MDKRTDRTKPDVDSMADQQDQQHAYRTQHDVHALRHIYGQLVEYTPQNRTCQTDCKQPDIRQGVTQQSGSHVVGIPKPCTEIQEDILSRRIIQVSYNQADNRNTDNDRLDGFGQLQIQHRQPECQCQCRNNKNPGKRSNTIFDTFLRFHLKSGNRLSEDNLNQTDND